MIYRYRPNYYSQRCFNAFWLLSLVALTACGGEADGIPPIDRPDLPRIAISGPDSVPAREKVAATMTVGTSGIPEPIRIERRGGFSIGFPKASYEIDLADDVPLLDLPADDDWILNANYIDKTFLRHVVAYELFREMHPENRAPRTAFTEVDWNGDYRGLYVLMEKVDRSVLDVKKDDPSAFIFKEPHLFRETYSGIEPARPGNFHHQTFPKPDEGDRSEQLEALRAILLDADTATFDAAIRQLLDVRNVADWHLLLLITNNADGLLKNFYLYRPDAATPIRVAPWDYDHSFGRDGDNERNLNERPLDANRSMLFRRLLDRPWYRKLLEVRWAAHQSSGLLSPTGLRARIDRHANTVRDAARRNFERWPVDGPFYYDAADFEAEVALMREFVGLRHRFLTDYIAGFP